MDSLPSNLSNSISSSQPPWGTCNYYHTQTNTEWLNLRSQSLQVIEAVFESISASDKRPPAGNHQSRHLILFLDLARLMYLAHPAKQ